jgi:isocitrate/isopropylmalate dehydrogenase
MTPVTLLVLPGDGIGPEIVRATLSVLRALDGRFALGLVFESHDIGLKSLAANRTTLPEAVVERVPQVDGVLLGPVSHNDYPSLEEGGYNPSGELRSRFDLYANIRPCRTREGLLGPLVKPMDLIIVRENTEGFYADRNMFAGNGEFMPEPDIALSIRKVTAKSSARIARTAFELARHRRCHVTVVHKANVLRVTDGLFLREVRAVAKMYSDIVMDEVLVDAAAALLVRCPDRFDVMVTTNMFGDILSDEASELSGSLGIAGSINTNGNICVAQAQHGSAPDIAGKAIANPTSLILSAGMLLDWLGNKLGRANFTDAARALDLAVDGLLASPATRTADLGGQLGTSAFAAALGERLERLAVTRAFKNTG